MAVRSATSTVATALVATAMGLVAATDGDEAAHETTTRTMITMNMTITTLNRTSTIDVIPRARGAVGWALKSGAISSVGRQGVRGVRLKMKLMGGGGVIKCEHLEG